MSFECEVHAATPEQLEFAYIFWMFAELSPQGCAFSASEVTRLATQIKLPLWLLDVMRAAIYERLKRTDVTQYSERMQTWWRERQEADRLRREVAEHAAAEKIELQAALAKLTPRELALIKKEAATIWKIR